jgi:integrase
VTPHVLRHTAATWLMQNGASLTVASEYLSMSEATLRRVYWHHHPDYMREAAEAIGRRRKVRSLL